MAAKQFLQGLWRQRALLYMLLVPLLLLPIAEVDPQPKWQCAYVVVLMACFWVPEVIPIGVTSLIPIFLFPMYGIVTAREVAKNYMSDATLIFVGGMALALAVETWDLHKRIALRILLLFGTDPKWLMLGLMSSTWLLSMWMSNTATTAMMVPIVQAILGQLKERVPSNEADAEASSNSPKSRRFERTCKGMMLSIAYAANIGGIGTLTGTGTNIVLKGQTDVLYGDYGETNPISFGYWMAFAIPLTVLLLAFAWVWLFLFYLACPCRDTGKETKPDREGVRKMILEEYQALGVITFAQYTVFVMFVLMTALWITRDLGGIGGWGMLFPKGFTSDATPAIFISVVLFILPANNPFKTTERETAAERLLTWRQFNSKMPWNIVLLVGGGFSLAQGCEVSGLSDWVGERFNALSDLHSTVMLIILSYIITALTQVTSNIAIATLLFPVLIQLAIATHVNPLYYIIPAALSTSLSFLLPVATPPNAIVFASGHVKVSDMLVAGLVLNIVAVPMLVMATELWGKPMFDLGVFPAMYGNVTSLNISSAPA